MRKELKSQIEFYKYYSKTSFYKMLILLYGVAVSFLTIVFVFGNKNNYSFFEIITYIFDMRQVVFITLIIFLLNAINIATIMNSNVLYRVRVSDSSFFKKIQKTIFFQSLFMFMITVLIVLICLNIFSSLNYSVNYLENKGVLNIVYFFWFIIKYCFWIFIFCDVIIWIYNIIGKDVSVVISIPIMIYLSFYSSNLISNDTISSISDLKYNINVFFNNSINYSFFIFEVLINILYILTILLFINYVNSKIININKNIKIKSLGGSL